MAAFLSLFFFLVTTTTALVTAPAFAQSFTISGVAGYLSEWQLSGNVTQASGTVRELVGVLSARHIGLCSHDGPDEKMSDITIQVVGAKVPTQIRATLNLDGARCSLSGPFSGTYTGHMDCAGAKGIPVSFSMK